MFPITTKPMLTSLNFKHIYIYTGAKQSLIFIRKAHGEGGSGRS